MSLEFTADRTFSMELVHASDAYEAALAERRDQARAEAAMSEAFLALVKRGDMDAAAGFGRPASIRTPAGWIDRPADLGDLLMDAMDYDSFMREGISLLVRAASGKQVEADANDLMSRLASSYASRFAGE